MEVEVISTGCRGLCELGPLVTIDPERTTYHQVSETDAQAIVDETLIQGQLVDRLLYVDRATEQAIPRYDEWPFFASETRRVLALNGEIDPTRIQDYMAHDGYASLRKVLHHMTPANWSQVGALPPGTRRS
jgi:(2Fe-2S) ferredoxin